MPSYLYRDRAGHMRRMFHRMLYTTGIICLRCALPMHRVPQAMRINWNGNRAVTEMHPNIRGLIDTAPQRRAEFAKEHEDHERRTAREIPGYKSL